ncbi:MAG: tRNA threonylcarbamoyladenosine biosynthesis protein TsaB [Sphingomonadales bacterium]|jgi:tRNA threonylcarbamoyl adenosine modification protein YeaZ|nr:tRNA threonylcarbamoyladenosine biosynthesis protein TsaB [Sphingomonadales bacterium]MEA3048424.1 tRNA threonylcarbamoyladenosine biosynthesis protein TsaB [Sphingomonadales bacterium]
MSPKSRASKRFDVCRHSRESGDVPGFERLTLVMETASAACSAALIAGGEVIAERHEMVGRGHAERLLPMVRELLAGRRPQALLVDCGPGSFTGVRVGLAAAHGLRIGWGVPLAGYSSMALAAAGAEEAEIAVALRGGHGQLFVQSFRSDPLRPTDALQSLEPEAAAAVMRAQVVLGSGAAALVEARHSGRAVDAELRAADARFLPEPLRSLPPRPIYGRGADARPMP